MAQKLLPPPPRVPDADDAAPALDGQRRVRVRDVAVTMVVCLGLWAFLFAPVLERNARTGPLGTRRTVALAVLRPVTAVADAAGLTSVSERALRALGDDPDQQPGGELDLPEIDLPPLPPLDPQDPGTTGSGTTGTGATGSSGSGTTGTGATGATGHHGNGDGNGSPPPGGEGDGNEDPPAPEVGPIRTPTSQNQLRVAIVGDSLSQGLGPSVEGWFDAEVARVLSLGRLSTGLARQDYFNWPRAMRQIEEEFRPDVVFIMLGTNDNQAQISPDDGSIPVGSVEWVTAYRERVEAFVHEATSAGTRVVWVGLPVVEERRRWDFYRRINAIYEEVANADPLATFVDTWERFEDRDGGYTAYLRNERGVLQEMRAGDGVHFTPTGYDFLAKIAIRAVDVSFGLPQRAVTFKL